MLEFVFERVIPFVFSMLFLAEPTHPISIFSLISHFPQYSYFKKFLLLSAQFVYCFWHAYISCVATLFFVYLTVKLPTACFKMHQQLRQVIETFLCKSKIIITILIINFSLNESNIWTKLKLRNIKHLSLNFRCLQLLNTLLQEVASDYFMPFYFLTSRIVIGSNLLLLKNWNSISAILTFSTVIVVAHMGNASFTMLLLMFAKNQKVSKMSLKSWRFPNLQKCVGNEQTDFQSFQAFKRSCKPIAVRFGSFYTVMPKSILEYYVSITKGTIRLKLAFDG